MALLDKAAILAATKLDHEDVEIKDVGTIRIRVMTGAERDAYEAAIVDARIAKKPYSVRTLLIAFCASDESGARLFGDEDIEAIGKLPGPMAERLVLVALRVNKLRQRDLTELEKN